MRRRLGIVGSLLRGRERSRPRFLFRVTPSMGVTRTSYNKGGTGRRRYRDAESRGRAAS